MVLTTSIKRLLYPLYILPRTSKNKRDQLQQLFASYQKDGMAVQNSQPVKIFSNREEDGIILKILAALNIKKGYFIDIGSNDCINSNCANLVFNFNWHGLFIDADDKLLNIGKRNYRMFGKAGNVRFTCSMLTPGNINDIILSASSTHEVDFMSIDIDGDDYSIWKALDCVKPKIVVIENKIEYGSHDVVIPAGELFKSSEWGASIVSMDRLANEKGYTLVATNAEGFNAFFLRDDCLKKNGISPLPVDKVLGEEAISKSFYSNSYMELLEDRIQKQ
jgi:hypothetical protein